MYLVVLSGTNIQYYTLIFKLLAFQAKSVISSETRNPLNPQTSDSRVFSLRSK